MSTHKIPQRSLKLKAGIIIVILQVILRFVIPSLIPSATEIGVLGGMVFGLAFMVWWAFFSRAPRAERWGAIALMILVLIITSQLLDDSIGTAMMGMMFPSYAIPVLCPAFLIWAVATQRLAVRLRWILMVLTITISCGAWTLVRSDGITGLSVADFTWRWAETAEERLIAKSDDTIMLGTSTTTTMNTEAEWPGFRGPGRDGIVHGTSISSDWSASPPEEMWRQAIGPGCSSFAIHGSYFYTQEQLGEDELVSCYELETGNPVWKHHDAARFWDSHAGAGPRSTPTLANGRVYTCGATGIVNVLNAEDGSVLWTRNAATDIKAETREWGFTSSPLVTGNVVIVALAGTPVAYDAGTGDLKWTGDDGGSGYSSPHLMTIDGVDQVLFMSENGAMSLAPNDGNLLWEYPWPQPDRILQPAQVPNGDVLLNTGGGKGMKRMKISKGSEGWSLVERWTSVELKSFFNDIAIHNGHAYGFSGPFLRSINLADGTRNWKGGRYGGQLILLADQDLLIILSEKGEIALVGATPEKFNELSKMPAIEGKTWNHPAMAGNILLVRNSFEMVAYQLSNL
jgi:outer membrane protein assembly factor BamB